MDARDILALIGLLLIAGGFYPIYWPLSMLVPGFIIVLYALRGGFAQIDQEGE